MNIAQDTRPGRLAAALLAMAGALLLAVALIVPARGADQAISIAGLAFNPGSVTLQVGETVTWTHNDPGIPHRVVSDTAGQFDSNELGQGQTFQQTFATAGTYTYHCGIHAEMTGTIIVQAAPSTQPTAQPPATGSGSGSAGGTGYSLALAAGGAALIALAAGSLALARRRA